MTSMLIQHADGQGIGGLSLGETDELIPRLTGKWKGPKKVTTMLRKRSTASTIHITRFQKAVSLLGQVGIGGRTEIQSSLSEQSPQTDHTYTVNSSSTESAKII